MKIQTENLIKALDNLKVVIKARVKYPLMHYIHMEAVNGTLTLKATNMDEYQIERIECEGDLAACCPMLSQLQYTIIGVTGETADLTLDGDMLTVAFKKNSLELKTLLAEEFPAFKSDDTKAIGVSCKDLATGISAVKWAASKDEVRYMLKSVHVCGQSKLLTVVATDSRQMAVWEMPLISADFKMNIPDVFAGNLCHALEREGALLMTSADCILVKHKTGSYKCKQVDGVYPDITTVTGKPVTKIGTFPVAGLLDCFNRIDPFVDPARTPAAPLEFKKQGGVVEFVGSGSSIQLHFDGSYTPKEFVCNAQAMRMCLTNLKAETATVSYNNRMLVLQADNLKILTMEYTGEFQRKPKKK